MKWLNVRYFLSTSGILSFRTAQRALYKVLLKMPLLPPAGAFLIGQEVTGKVIDKALYIYFWL